MWDFEQLEYICVILRTCPQLACCLLNTDLGPTVIHTFQPSVLLTPLWVTLLFLYTGSYFYSFAFLTPVFIVALLLRASASFFAQGLLATLQHQKSDIEISCPFMSVRDTERGKMRKRHRRE